jgi:hypothetical protein
VTAPLRLTAVSDGSLPMPEYRALAAAAGAHAGAPVRWVEGTPADVAHVDGFVLLVSVLDAGSALRAVPAERAAELMPWLVPSESSPRRALEALAVAPTAAVLDRRTLREWTPGVGVARGPCGLRSVAETVGATCAELYGDDRHCLLQSRRHDGLPHLLVDYLRAHQRARSA